MYGILVRWYGEAVFLFYCLSLQVGTSEYNAGLSLERERESYCNEHEVYDL
jgi:hypothetical protein